LDERHPYSIRIGGPWGMVQTLWYAEVKGIV